MPPIPAQALIAACQAGDAAAVSRLLPAGGTNRTLSAQRFQSPNDKATPLIIAAKRGHTGIVRMILERAPNTCTPPPPHTNWAGCPPHPLDHILSGWATTFPPKYPLCYFLT